MIKKKNCLCIYLLLTLQLCIQITYAIPCFFVEGVVGAGKTTFVELLSRTLQDCTVVYEPVELFTNVRGAGNILHLYYTDPQRWSFTTEVYISLMHAKAAEQYGNDVDTSIAIIDRSLYADRYVFGKMAYEMGTMNVLEWTIYNQIFELIMKNSCNKPSGFIYLAVSPETALKRVKQRNRSEEKDVSLEYQKNLNRFYHEWFIEKKDISEEIAQVPLLIIDAEQNFKDDPVIQQQCVNQVKDFIQNCLKHYIFSATNMT